MNYPVLLLVCAAAAPALGSSQLTVTEQAPSKHKLFVQSKNQLSEGFDSWHIDSGYAYSLSNSFDLYVGTRVRSEGTTSDTNFLSGFYYHFNDKLSVNSLVYTSEEEQPGVAETPIDSGINAEVSGSFELIEGVNLHATLDYDEWQQGITFGLGYNF